MATFLFTPILAFFSPRLYRSVLKSGAGYGFGYLAYLTGLFCLVAFLACRLVLIPTTSSFTTWLIEATPEMALTSTGLELLESGAGAKTTQPYLVKHPVLGPLYLIDTTKTASELLADESGALILIGREQVVIRGQGAGERRVFELKEAMERVREAGRPAAVTKQIMRELAKQLQALLVPFVLILFAPIFFVWKLLAALLYFLIALALNLLRKERFGASRLFALSCVVISPVTVIQWAGLLVTDFPLTINFPVALLVTTAYLAYAMFLASRGK